MPIEWEPDPKMYKLGNTRHVTHIKYNEIRFPLRTGPDSSDSEKIDEVALNEFVDDFFKPWYKCAEGAEDEQIEGEDPII